MDMPGLAVSDPNPGDYIYVQFGAGANAGDLSTKKILIIAPSTADGTIVQDTEVAGPFSDTDEVKAKCGVRSPVRRMIEAFWRINQTTQLYAICPTRSAGTAATLVATLVAAGGATDVGTIGVRICEEVIEIAFATGDTVTQIMTDLAAAINARTHLPVTASNVAGVLTLTSVIAGPEGNALRAQFYVKAGTVTSLSATTDTAFTGGATQTSYTNALASIAPQDFDIIVSWSHAGAGSDPQLTALANQVQSQQQPATGIRQVVVGCCSLPASTFVTLCQSINKPRITLDNLEESPVEPWVVAAQLAAVFANKYFTDPSSNLKDYGTGADDVFPVMAPRNKAMWFTRTERTLQLNGGGTPLGVTSTGQVYITRQITTRCLDGSFADYKTRDAHKVFVADKFADDLLARIKSTPFKKLTKDPADGEREPPAIFATPSRLKSVVEQQVIDHSDEGWLDPGSKKKSLDAISVIIEPANQATASIAVPIWSAFLLLKTQTKVSESSPAY